MSRLAPALGLVLLFLAPRLRTQDVLYTFSGASPDQQFGNAVAGAGDLDGDGRPDLVVGAHGDDTTGLDAGAAFAYSGADGALLHAWFGEAAGDGFGIAVAGAGDVDADGHDDVLVGAYRHDTAGDRAGRATVFSGLDGAPLLVLDGHAAGDEFGVALAGAGDLDEDGHDDLAVGAHHVSVPDDHVGSVRMVSGLDGGELFSVFGAEAMDDLGHSVAAAGDVDQDGVPDVLAGAHDIPDPGGALVYSGADGRVLLQWMGASPGDLFGRAVGGPGDVDGDGVPDLLVGAARDDGAGSDAGRTWLYSGQDGSVLLTFLGDAPGDQLGLSVSGAGDFDGDGLLDVAAGAPGDDTAGLNSGSARVWSGLDGTPLLAVHGDSIGERFDVQVAPAGDLDGDGRPELLIGWQYDDTAGVDAGIVRVVSGALPAWEDLGRGLPGAAGVPALSGTGLLAGGTPGSLSLQDAAASAPLLLLLSLSVTPVDFKGGTLLAFPVLAQLPLATDALGELLLAWAAWPAGVPPGTTLVWQCAVQDAGAPKGVALSNGLLGTTR